MSDKANPPKNTQGNDDSSDDDDDLQNPQNQFLLQLLMGHHGFGQGPPQAPPTNKDLIQTLQTRKALSAPDLIDAFEKIPRGNFVPDLHQSEAFVDTPIRLSQFGFNISAPHMYAVCLRELQILRGSTVLDVGSGSGHFTALAGYLTGPEGSVLGIDLRDDITQFSRENVNRFMQTSGLPLHNVRFQTRNCFLPCNEMYDRIHIGACLPSALKDNILSLLKPNGILVTPFEDHLCKFVKDAENRVNMTQLMAVRYGDLVVPSEPEIRQAKRDMERLAAITIHVPPDNFVAQMYGLLNRPELSDVTLILNGKKIFCHRFILSVRSPFFKTMFSSGMKEATAKEIPIPDFPEDAFMTALEEIYGGNPPLKNADQAIEVLGPASYMHLDRLQLACENLIRTNLENETSVYVLQIADQYQCSGLKHFCLDFIVRNFDEVSKLDAFNNLDKSLILEVTKAAIAFGK